MPKVCPTVVNAKVLRQFGVLGLARRWNWLEYGVLPILEVTPTISNPPVCHTHWMYKFWLLMLQTYLLKYLLWLELNHLKQNNPPWILPIPTNLQLQIQNLGWFQSSSLTPILCNLLLFPDHFLSIQGSRHFQDNKPLWLPTTTQLLM